MGQQTQELFDFVESYSNYPDLASNMAIDAEEQGRSGAVVNFFETLGDTVVEGKEQVIGIIEQLDEDMPAM